MSAYHPQAEMFLPQYPSSFCYSELCGALVDQHWPIRMRRRQQTLDVSPTKVQFSVDSLSLSFCLSLEEGRHSPCDEDRKVHVVSNDCATQRMGYWPQVKSKNELGRYKQGVELSYHA